MIQADVLAGLIDEREDIGVFRVNRRMFIDEEIFALEMEHIFEGNWVFVAHESQLPNQNDFITTHIGRQPVILTRAATGEITGLLNTCQHRGAVLELMSRGNKKLFVCPFHAWSYKNDGQLMACGDAGAGYGGGFDKSNHALRKVARVESYRGFVFASLKADVMSLPDYLGAAKTFIDLIVDQDPNGEIEVIPGAQTYTYDGNWKLQSENGVDGYHVNMIHGNYVQTTNNRQRMAGDRDVTVPIDVSRFGDYPGGYYALDNGHVVLWNESPNPEVRPAHASRARYVEHFGENRAKWMSDCWRNLFIFPNLFLMDQMSTQIRMFRPLAIDRTEVRVLAFAPKCDTQALRAKRIRQYEDFFNASGMATPDDLAAFNATQIGFKAHGAEWSDISRGAANRIQGSDDRARQLGIEAQFTGTQLQDEGLYLNQHHRWLKLLTTAIAERDAGAEVQ